MTMSTTLPSHSSTFAPAPDERDAKRAILEELVYEAVRQYVELWKNTQYAQAIIEHIEQTRADCADTLEQQLCLVDEYTNRAWARLARERGALDE